MTFQHLTLESRRKRTSVKHWDGIKRVTHMTPSATQIATMFVQL
uniref:Transposase n=1 Tax=Wolbachia endosymbiont of Oeneis ivallda TaxID=3171168 RepID=A0AAU7YMJ3_9RICK